MERWFALLTLEMFLIRSLNVGCQLIYPRSFKELLTKETVRSYKHYLSSNGKGLSFYYLISANNCEDHKLKIRGNISYSMVQKF